jgi:hypothetical protein
MHHHFAVVVLLAGLAAFFVLATLSFWLATRGRPDATKPNNQQKERENATATTPFAQPAEEGPKSAPTSFS